ncbi:hypothetical protein B0P06_003911 [Clostridium saccharoperbutylacetonicum]|uniref:Uncharacterized protein n=1 Tax=Clostridium saccharoperbutylacetonicum N1-4(HMT) TaxID=931276 RepID=M1MIQ2_9CLOT|nr:hypothetical protein [Clostridium saccharoperbutylacetonicum]AGF57784.1 hypothetical protein Cspa_c40270 [Clostridium saccharoperbutylacetonicum N1-4(HMT)]NRT61448.1 hypothetical protein [Clostridium saccharoperbutylacetonicum]NSB24768.1 hypothetical protein [Clostridium saccharoperbutylacetonicum]NSB44140.1 hypothetical protein [Clostridium saccharoperbutylacetonicum]
MSISNEKVKLDEVLKFLFSTSKKVLVNLLNGIFQENYSSDQVKLSVSNNEFVMDTFDTLRGDVFFDILNSESDKISYHLEFQTRNDSTMVIRMFEYGLRKAKEQSRNNDDFRTIFFPKQKVIFFEENRNIMDIIKLKIVLPSGESFLYSVPVMKYWEYSDKKLLEDKMYPLLPLQLFNLRRELEQYKRKNDIKKINELSIKAKEIAEKIANESKELFEKNEIIGEDFHKMLLAIQNLIEYLNRNYFNDEKIEEEVIRVTKTLFDPEVEKRKAIEIAKNLLDILDNETIALKTGLELEEVIKLRNAMQTKVSKYML